MSQNPNKSTVVFREYDFARMVRQTEGMPKKIPVYQFGSVTKYEAPTIPGQVYPWARDIDENDKP